MNPHLSKCEEERLTIVQIKKHINESKHFCNMQHVQITGLKKPELLEIYRRIKNNLFTLSVFNSPCPRCCRSHINHTKLGVKTYKDELKQYTDINEDNEGSDDIRVRKEECKQKLQKCLADLNVYLHASGKPPLKDDDEYEDNGDYDGVCLYQEQCDDVFGIPEPPEIDVTA